MNERNIFRGNSGGSVFAFDKRNGEIVWRFGTELYISETDMELGCTRRPLVVDNLIYLGNGMGEVKCFKVSPEYELAEKYFYQGDSSVTTEILLDGEILWFATEKGYLYAMNKETGEEEMKKKKVGAVPRWLSVYENGLLILSDKGQVEFLQK